MPGALLPGSPRQIVTFSLMLGMFLAALEATAVAAAVPTAVGQLGGVGRYSWAFSAYLLASTVTVPLYGKLADLYGRRPIYQGAVALFLVGSALCGLAATFPQLVFFRALQGMGAGGVSPIAATVIADIYPLEERGRIQGVFSGTWAFASLAGPLLGGLITDALSWRWIFYLNIPPGIASAWLLTRWLSERAPRRAHRLDWAGAVTLTVAISLLLIGLTEGAAVWTLTDPRTLALVGGGAAGCLLFLHLERRSAEPMLPLDLFRNRVIGVANAGNVLLGALLFALTAYVPLFAQGVLGGTAVDAGTVLTPMLIGWPIASTLAGRLLLRTSYRPLALAGGIVGLAGCAMLVGVDAGVSRAWLGAAMLVIGLGTGLVAMPYFVAVQNAVPWGRRGVATSSTLFFRTVGGALAVAALGALLQVRLEAAGAAGRVAALLDPRLRAGLPASAVAATSGALAGGLQQVYWACAVLAAAALAVAWTFPRGSAQSHAYREPREPREPPPPPEA